MRTCGTGSRPPHRLDAAVMMAGMGATPGSERLLAVIELQNAIAAAGMNSDEVMRIVAERASTLTSASGGMVALAEGDDIVYRSVVGSGLTPALGMRLSKTETLAGRCVTERKTVRVDDVVTDPQVDAETRARAKAGSLICVPLLYGEHAIGVLEVVSPKNAAFTEQDAETLPLLAQIIAISLHRAHTYPRPRYDSLHDALTGLANRRAFDERIAAELERSRRYKHFFSLAMLDLDGLESANDRLGQAAGDEILRDIATILKKHTRVIDACFRLSGDEFAIVMPGTSLEGAKVLAERFRGHISDAGLCNNTITSSFGVVQAVHETAAELIERANAALDVDKQSRR
jgi:diguanylate cyclase (GGDEF)-like protein